MILKKILLILSFLIFSSGLIRAEEWPTNVKELEKLAKNNPAALVKLGDMYMEGQGVEKNEKKGVDYYKKALKKNDLEAMYKLSNAYLTGKGIKEDTSEGLRLLREAAEKGNVNAQKQLAYLYSNENDYVYKVYDKAVKNFTLAADQGDLESQVTIGNFYLYGYHVDRNYETAFHYLDMAAKQGNAEAQFEMANMYKNGIWVEKNDEEAIKYFKLAADQGYAPALAILGEIYVDEELIKGKREEGLRFIRMACEKNDIYAYLVLGNLYYTGTGVPENDEESVKCYMKAMELGKAKYDSQIARLNEEISELEKEREKYRNDRNVKEIVKKAVADEINLKKNQIKVLKEELKQPYSYIQAVNNLGEMYRDGEGVEKDPDEALRLFKIAEEYENAYAFYNLALIEEEKGNDYKAHTYYVKAAAKGHVAAIYEEGLYYWNENNKARNYGADNFKKAAEKGHAWAYFNLGKCYYYGKGVKQSYQEAIKYFTLASDAGIGIAKEMLGYCYYFGTGVPEDRATAYKLFKEGYSIAGLVDKLPENCLYVYGTDRVGVFNVATDKMMIPVSDDIKYFPEEKEFRVVNGQSISYYNPSGVKLTVKPQFVVKEYYWKNGVNYDIDYIHPDKTEYTVEVQYYNANGTPFKKNGQGYLIAQNIYTPQKIKGTFTYSGGSYIFGAGDTFRKNVKYLLKLHILDKNKNNVPFVNNKKPLEIYF